MRPALRAAFEREMRSAYERLEVGDDATAFHHLERAHILGQRYVVAHTRAHWGMLRIGWGRRDLREVIGQWVRIPGAVIGSAIGVVPEGNTGGANVSAFAAMEIPPDLAAVLADEA